MTTTEFNSELVKLQNKLQYFANSLTGNNEDANDLLQDTFLKALVNREKFHDNTNLKAWIFTIMKNTFINNYRKSHKINALIDKIEDLNSIHRKSNLPTPDSEFQENEIYIKISRLDETQRLPFEMYHSGYKYHEIADRLNISIGTIKSRIFITRKKLMASLENYYQN
jgi:RNA polymerase sigma-70 factor (ECF subfamily)